MNIAVVALLPSSANNLARELQWASSRITGNQYGLDQPPHITIKTAFDDGNGEDLQPGRMLVDSIASETGPFSVAYTGIGVFAPHVVYLDVLESPELVRLHQRALRESLERFRSPPGPFEGPNVKFHTSIAFTTERTEKVKAVAEPLVPCRERLTFMVREIGLFCQPCPCGGWLLMYQSELIP